MVGGGSLAPQAEGESEHRARVAPACLSGHTVPLTHAGPWCLRLCAALPLPGMPSSALLPAGSCWCLQGH